MIEKKQKEKRGLVKTIITVSILVLAVNFGPKLFNQINENSLNENTTLSEGVKIMNKNCPLIIDEYTRLDSVTLPKKNILQSNYTLTSQKIIETDINSFNEILKPEIIKHIKSDKDSEFIRKNKPKIIYKYFDKESKFITDIVILPNEY